MLALLVLHRAKLLASNQSILALGVAPMQVVSRLCRCIVQRLCATDCKRPCLVGRQPHIQPRHGCRACMPKGSARCRANKAYTAFPGERGLGIGIENKHFFSKTDFFYKLNVIICLLPRQKHRVFKNYIIHHPDASMMPHFS